VPAFVSPTSFTVLFSGAYSNAFLFELMVGMLSRVPLQQLLSKRESGHSVRIIRWL